MNYIFQRTIPTSASYKVTTPAWAKTGRLAAN